MSSFDWKWPAESIDARRIERASEVKIGHLEISENVCRGVFIGGKGNLYTATLDVCDCPDFAQRHGAFPCKHILRLAMEAGIINKIGNTPDQQAKADMDFLRYKLAVAYGFYYLLDDPMMSDQEYDRLKQRFVSLGGLNSQAKPVQTVLRDEVIKYLNDNGLEYIDKTSSGGSLYFFHEQAAERLEENGYAVRYAQNGARSTSGKPAWYINFK